MLTADALIAPKGELAPDLFDADDAGGSTTARVEAALLAVGADTSDAIAAAYVYARLYNAKANALAAMPSSMTIDGDSETWSAAQINHFQALAAKWQAVYERLTATPPVFDGRRRSRSVRGRVVR
jgi:hypothetical protein